MGRSKIWIRCGVNSRVRTWRGPFFPQVGSGGTVVVIGAELVTRVHKAAMPGQVPLNMGIIDEGRTI